MTIAILSALPQEQEGLVHALSDAQGTAHAGRMFWRGRLHGHDVVCALSGIRSEEHTSELQSQSNLVCRLLLEKKKKDKSISRNGKIAERDVHYRLKGSGNVHSVR